MRAAHLSCRVLTFQRSLPHVTRGRDERFLRLPAPVVHADLARFVALAVAHEHRPAALIEIARSAPALLRSAAPRATGSPPRPGRAALASRFRPGASQRRSLPRWADRPGSATLCCVGVVQRGGRATSPTNAAGLLRLATRSRSSLLLSSWTPLRPASSTRAPGGGAQFRISRKAQLRPKRFRGRG